MNTSQTSTHASRTQGVDKPTQAPPRPHANPVTQKPGCSYTTLSGNPCRAWALSGTATCFVHSPVHAAARHSARARGGVAAAKKRALQNRIGRLQTPASLKNLVADLVRDVVAGNTPPEVARVTIYALSLQRTLIETCEMEQRLGDLERQAKLAAARASRTRQ